MSSNLSSLQCKFLEKKDALLECNIKRKEPITLFKEWLKLACESEEISEPNAASLATVNKDGKPSCRIVIMKDVAESGFTFCTNYGSSKAADIAVNNNVAMTLYWSPLRRQIRIEGQAAKISQDESLIYWRERARACQIGVCASEQSTRIPNRELLEKKENDLINKLEGSEVPMPDWGGYLIRPNLIEFWQGQTNRLHDRIRFRKTDLDEVDGIIIHEGENGWVYERLSS